MLQRNIKKLHSDCWRDVAQGGFIWVIDGFFVNVYKEYASLKSRELEELLRFQVISWQPS